jgi:acyl-homoserine-lactone acylase
VDSPGSNALALSGSRTTTGKPILLGNPHLQWSSLYWEAHVRVPGKIDFYGSTLPGVPVLRAGFNDRLAFVTTNNAPDLDDVFTLKLDPQKPDHYVFDGESLPLRHRDVTVAVRGSDGTIRSEPRTFWSTHIGVVVYRNADRAFVVKSTRLDALEYYGGFYVLSKARSLNEWLAALRQNFVPTSNFTYADADNNIMYVWNGRVPVRKEGVDYRLDVEASSSTDLWARLHDVDDYPRALNPPGGYIQNSNNPPRFVSARDPIDMSRYPADFERGPLALRPQLALDMLESQPKFSVEDVIRLKYSTRLLLAERVKADVVAAVRESTDASPEARAGADVLEGWDNQVSATSRGAVLFQRFWDLYSGGVRPPYAVVWDDANPTTTPRGIADRAAAVRLLGNAVRSVREQHGSESVAWGDVHRFRAPNVDLPADGASGTYGAYRVMTFVEGPDRQRVAGHLPGRASPVGFGDGWILLVDFSKPGTAWSVLAYGQTTKQDSPHSSDQMPLFAAHRLRPALYSEADITANTTRVYRP